MNENERMLDMALADANDELRVLRLRVTQMQADLEALAQPAQEPIGYLCENATGHKYFRWKKPSSVYKPIALYAKP